MVLLWVDAMHLFSPAPQNPAVILSKSMCNATFIHSQFRKLIQNLTSNALKFSLPGVPRQISSETKRGSSFNADGLSPIRCIVIFVLVTIEFAFDPQYKDKIFDIFQRLDSKEEYTDTGIGLSVVKKIMENHNGVITATSGQGQGATFGIYLPI
jgi:light-regulated signal transduction histidine kinase (bacteriophytochrome)